MNSGPEEYACCALHVGKGVLCMGMRGCMDVCTCVYVCICMCGMHMKGDAASAECIKTGILEGAENDLGRTRKFFFFFA